MTKTSDIDFIIPWVDRSDKEWIKSFNTYSPEHMRLTDSRIERYRDWGLLKYISVVASLAELGISKPDKQIFLKAFLHFLFLNYLKKFK